ncbi:MAG: threonine synthase [Clostridia bacterium]|nr:threonine synthase [Clostridia bacterium]
MLYTSTRDKTKKISGASAIVSGISDEGGLFVPQSIPKLSGGDIKKLLEMDYCERAAYIMNLYLTEFSFEQLLACAKKAYLQFGEDAAPIVKIDKKLFMLELWHGPTLAFKDMALTVLPHLLSLSKQHLNIKDKTLILVATSGDTGKAALEGFKDVDDTKICVFYPSDGVSNMQKLQMITQEGKNVNVFGIKGNFDDCQNSVKQTFNDSKVIENLKSKGYSMSSANSINWGRLLPQIVYYISAYLDMLGEEQISEGEKINFCVPTGNFGNILAGYYAKQMGLPIDKLICASNSNNVLTDFFRKGEYNIKRPFFKTISPSMDILISSNLERLLFYLSEQDDKLTSERINALYSEGRYHITDEERGKAKQLFYANYSDEDDSIETIQDFFDEYSYPLDPHTGVAVSVYNKYKKDYEKSAKTVIISTASPYKFPQDVLFSITGDYCGDSFRSAKKLYKKTALDLPEKIMELKTKPQRFKQIISTDEVNETVLKFAD